jgi:hypothetical protein
MSQMGYKSYLSMGQRFRPETWPAWLRFLHGGLLVVLRFVLECIDTLVDWMESRVFQAIRIALTLGIIWFFVKRTHWHSEGVGLSTSEFAHYGRAAVGLAVVAVCMSLLWSGFLTDGLAGVVMFLIDDPDDRPLREDPMHRLERLVRTGRIRRARWLCRRMIRRKEGSRLALETLQLHLRDCQAGRVVIGGRPTRISGGK